ncbi:MAG: DMT family transporter [Gemmobacter sp.]
MRRADALSFGALVVFGAGWGLGAPLTKIVVSEGYGGFGVVFWWQVLGLVSVALVAAFRGRGLVLTLPALRLYAVIALTGAVIPNYTSLLAAQTLPAGILSLVISTTPLLVFALGLLLERERLDPLRILGLALGLSAMAFVALPETSLPERAMLAALPIALVTPMCYAIESHSVAGYADLGLDPVQALLGAFLFGTLLTLPLALASGTFIVPAATRGQAAMAVGAVLNAGIYVGYVWLVGRAGPTFAAQVSYLVTAFGLVWAMLLLGERFSGWVWLAFVLLMAGIALVQPRPRQRATCAAPAKDPT